MATPAPIDPDSPVLRLRQWLAPLRRVFVLTGAGCSTASGIPDYRDADGQWKRTQPVTYQAFVGDPLLRARYWARSFIGWPMIERARPNPAHAALAQWQAQGRLLQLLTQNVDGLHQQAGSADVIDLHGRLDDVVCLQCTSREPRSVLQGRLHEANAGWAVLSAGFAPDGDADLEGVDFSSFGVPPCQACGGMLKPDVVFFGESVPRARYEAARAALDAADALLVVGSSLMVYSGYRFARQAHERGIVLAIVNQGVTRADELADLKLEVDCARLLPAVLAVDACAWQDD
jgi:NAD-dependent SIR2 family protein deacetylase